MTPQQNFVMKMRTSTITGATDGTNYFAFSNIITMAYIKLGHVSVSSFITIIVVDTDIFAITIIPAGIFYITGSSRIYGSTIVICNIKTAMPIAGLTVEGIVTTAKFGCNIMAIGRPYVRSHFPTIIFLLQLSQQFIPIFCLML